MYLKSLLYWSALASLAAARSVPKRNGPAPLMRASDEHRVPGMYIVKMKDGFVAADADRTLTTHMSSAKHMYGATSFKGFASALDDAALESLRANPHVEYVQEDSKVHLYDYTTQENAPYGIARISHRNNGDNNYVRDSSDGEGTCVYVIDTGINVDHPDFGGRASWGANFADDENIDGAGHGTFVAGIVGSNSYGVAKKTQLLAVKVFKNDGTTDGNSIIAAIDWVAQDAPSRGCPKGTVANLSLGGGRNQASNDAVAALVNAGTFVAVASGNDNADAENTSPASEPSVCTVSASDENDAKASYSNYGAVVDIWAPGNDIESTSYQGGSTTASGTSAASPIVAGLGAYLLAFEGSRDPVALCDRIKELSTQGKISGVGEGTTTALAFNGNPSG
ncbi:peptidase S8/S53 domain-containing protein [Xylaria bambusicola]|uniref:peptidase S8/S53 domain-containing protein n=1 Tax=Xylaria bambusicola TaxID=326684 RepID=UPI002008B2AE|nr:peptidase S8/S53 domain-containing protein [Xylaria bambusicola]KAI0522122.1 peptidase S8/S53 domain-containing protein [Xylaria bambusicola]